jgi:hypothetical protein
VELSLRAGDDIGEDEAEDEYETGGNGDTRADDDEYDATLALVCTSDCATDTVVVLRCSIQVINLSSNVRHPFTFFFPFKYLETVLALTRSSSARSFCNKFDSVINCLVHATSSGSGIEEFKRLLSSVRHSVSYPFSFGESSSVLLLSLLFLSSSRSILLLSLSFTVLLARVCDKFGDRVSGICRVLLFRYKLFGFRFKRCLKTKLRYAIFRVSLQEQIMK